MRASTCEVRELFVSATVAPAELLGGALGEQQDRLHLAVARDRDVGQQHEVVGVARVLDRGDRRDVELAVDERDSRGPSGSALTRSTSSSTSFFTSP